MRNLRARIQAATPAPVLPPEPPQQSKKDVVVTVLALAVGSLAGRVDRLTKRVERLEREKYPVMRPRG